MSILEDVEVSLRLRTAAAEALLRESLETYAGMTTEDFGLGADRDMRERVARFLGLDPAAYCIWITTDPPSTKKLSRQARAIRTSHQRTGRSS